jgi:two-component system sensor histidine kinase PilS (NtrC family)
MGVRLLCSTLLMGGTVVFQLQNLEQNAHPTQNFAFWLVGATYFLTLVYSFFFPRVEKLRRFASIQLSADVLVISLLVLATGGHDSLFLFCYLLVIVGAAFLLYRKGAFLFAATSLAMLALVLFGAMFEGVQSLPFVRISVALRVPELLYILVVHAPAFFLTALLTSHLAEQVRHSGEILKQQQIDFDNLEALHKDIIESLASGLIATDLQGRIQFFNRFACELTSTPKEELLGRSLMEVFPSLRDSWDTPPQRSKKERTRLEIPFHRPNQAPRIFGCGMTPLHNSDDEQIGILLLFQDLTPIKRMEAVAREKEKLASIGGMAAGLAHEIRNPLSSVSGAIQMLRTELALEEDERVLMDIVVKEAERLNRLLSEFLLFARPKQISKLRTSLSSLINEAVYLFAQDPAYQDVEVNVSIPDGCEIDVDSELFHQSLWNLMINAAQAVPKDSGTITIVAETGEKGVIITLTDNGSGIPDDLKHQVFEPFFSTKNAGTGLGLAVVQRIVSEHGGHVSISPDYQEGTQFVLFYPSEHEESESAFLEGGSQTGVGSTPGSSEILDLSVSVEQTFATSKAGI